jgi:dynein heavy chain, axonemal
MKPGNIVPTFSVLPTAVVQSVKDVFEDGVKCLQEIPQLEPRLLHTLFKTHAKKTVKAPIIPQEKPKIPEKSNKKALVDENTWLWDAQQVLIENLERAVEPLDKYVQTFAAFKEENELNPDKYMKTLDDPENPMEPAALKADIFRHRKLEEQLMAKIPESVNVGMFQINCKDIRNAYAAKYRDIQDKELKLIAQRAKENTYSLNAKFGEITAKILTVPKTIDDMTDLKKYI